MKQERLARAKVTKPGVVSLRSLGGGVDGSGTSSADTNRPTRDSSKSRRASERRKPWVTITWMRDCVLV